MRKSYKIVMHYYLWILFRAYVVYCGLVLVSRGISEIGSKCLDDNGEATKM